MRHSEDTIENKGPSNDSGIVRVRLDGLSTPVDFVDCEDFRCGFGTLLSGWTVETRPVEAPGDDAIVVSRKKGVYRWKTPWAPHSAYKRSYKITTVMEAMCSFHYDFIGWYLHEQKTHLCLHAAASRFGKGLVVFPCLAKAGKSTLTAQIAARGHKVYSDDILELTGEDGSGMSAGFQPRLRLPLPDTLPPCAQAFIESRTGIHNHQYMYLALEDGELARHGEAAPIDGFVLLDRKKKGKARLEPLSDSEMLSEVISQNSRRRDFPTEIFDRMHGIVERSRNFRLTYSKGLDAIELLEREFGT